MVTLFFDLVENVQFQGCRNIDPTMLAIASETYNMYQTETPKMD